MRHNALSYHRVREAIAANILKFMHIDSKFNPSDILTKFMGWNKFWPLVQPMLFWKGETLKDQTVSDCTPLPETIKILQDCLPSGLRGVTSSKSSWNQDIGLVSPLKVRFMTENSANQK